MAKKSSSQRRRALQDGLSRGTKLVLQVSLQLVAQNEPIMGRIAEFMAEDAGEKWRNLNDDEQKEWGHRASAAIRGLAQECRR